MREKLEGFADVSRLEEVTFPIRFVKPYEHLCMEKKQGGVEINGEFIEKQDLPILLRFLAGGKLNAQAA